MDRQLDIIQAALRIGVHPATIRRAMRRGNIPHQRRAGKIFFCPEDLEAWAARRRDSREIFDAQREIRLLRDDLARLVEDLQQGLSAEQRSWRPYGRPDTD